MRRLESSVQTSILSKLRQIPNSDWIKPTQTNMAGTPDVLGHINGRFVAIEIKRDEQSKPTALQRYHIERLKEHGAIAFVAWNFEMIREELARHGIRI